MEVGVSLTALVPSDGCLDLRWQSATTVKGYHLLIIRTGAVPAHTSIGLSAETEQYRIQNLSRHQRYRLAVIATTSLDVLQSEWVSLTPKVGLSPQKDEKTSVATSVARIEKLIVMPQDQRLTAFWQRSVGFVENIVLEVCGANRVLRRFSLEPEVSSLALDAERGVRLANGKNYAVRIATRFASITRGGPPEVLCAPAPQGEERAANREHVQSSLIYPSLSLAPEIDIFSDTKTKSEPEQQWLCVHCQAVVEWHNYTPRCTNCGATYIFNGRGDYLDRNQLRFGTCQCCLPQKILIRRFGTEALTCSHSGKEHIRLPGVEGFQLIEDLPHGLCQCCRPRRPLTKSRRVIRCSKSGEKHESGAEPGQYVLVPKEPIFDAAAIDDLLDAGLAEICDTGVSSTNRTRR